MARPPARRGAGHRPLDAHTHLGFNDPDGYSCTHRGADGGARGHRRPRHRLSDARAGRLLRPPTTWCIEEAEARGGRLFPFGRLDPHDDALAEAERTLDGGARGIKLHPRAEQFSARPSWARTRCSTLADERHLPVLCHAGRGIPALGRHSVDLHGPPPRDAADPRARRDLGPRLDLARRRDLPNLFFDTSWWSASDLQALLALVPPGQVLMASDAPYGSPAWAPPSPGATPSRSGSTPIRSAACSAARPRDSWTVRSRSISDRRPGADRLVARPAARPRLRVPHERPGPDVPGGRAHRDAGARPAGLRRGRRRSAGSGVPVGPRAARRARALLTRGRRKARPTSRPASTSSWPRRLVRTPDVPVPEFRPATAG